ncbi:MAG: DUF29 domain-containing protein [Okeania sp. SIO2D1]|uniref:DUF29 family protein n=1 Tax=Okeania sp. SIO2C9 TaxID=2607791 RepID=UPI0013BB7AFE|nr:DUF29 family protein [Okeania sp. SIO2C9]NEQ75190.1 DUF29 domain-containing protein [Okeania sp. SIO2C9]NES70863.1 DUF29 domain-containing protein [Okeania sp. SIO2D1]
MTTQELIDLRTCIMEGINHDALAIIDELDAMSKKDTLFKIDSYLTVVLINLIKNQVEKRLTNSWAASIRTSIRKIKSLNLKENKISYYIKEDEWGKAIAQVIEAAIRDASVEALDGNCSPFQLKEMVETTQVTENALSLLSLIYAHQPEIIAAIIDDNLALLPGGEDWKFGRRNK